MVKNSPKFITEEFNSWISKFQKTNNRHMALKIINEVTLNGMTDRIMAEHFVTCILELNDDHQIRYEGYTIWQIIYRCSQQGRMPWSAICAALAYAKGDYVELSSELKKEEGKIARQAKVMS